MNGIFSGRQVLKDNFNGVTHFSFDHWSHDSQVLLFFVSFLLLSEGSVCVFPINCLLEYPTKKTITW